jgi:hypothetical protein
MDYFIQANQRFIVGKLQNSILSLEFVEGACGEGIRYFMELI